MASDLARQTNDHLAQMLGAGGGDTRKATEQSARNLEAMVRSTTLFSQAMQDISREYLELWRRLSDAAAG